MTPVRDTEERDELLMPTAKAIARAAGAQRLKADFAGAAAGGPDEWPEGASQSIKGEANMLERGWSVGLIAELIGCEEVRVEGEVLVTEEDQRLSDVLM